LPQPILIYVWICLPGRERYFRSSIPYIFLFRRVQNICEKWL